MIYLALYVIGVAIGLMVMRDSWGARLATALCWPLGPIAFVLVVSVMLIVAAILWPVPVLGAAALLGAVIWLVT